MEKVEFVCVLDFEATCWRDTNNHEIIEFPSVLLKWDNNDIEEVSRFQTYVKPKKNPVISEFCEELTGIKQKTIDQGVPLNLALKNHFEWLAKNTNNYRHSKEIEETDKKLKDIDTNTYETNEIDYVSDIKNVIFVTFLISDT
jgi:inhibitor of KinA sporulation pathway (predicted exonuclease)